MSLASRTFHRLKSSFSLQRPMLALFWLPSTVELRFVAGLFGVNSATRSRLCLRNVKPRRLVGPKAQSSPQPGELCSSAPSGRGVAPGGAVWGCVASGQGAFAGAGLQDTRLRRKRFLYDMRSWHRSLVLGQFWPNSLWIGQSRFQSEVRAKTWEVSSLGRVKTLKGVVHRGTLACHGYRRAQIEGTNYYVHRLVARVFHGPPPSAAHTQVNHLDGDRANNRVDNLEYVTPSENSTHWHNTRCTTAGKAVRCRPCDGGAWVAFPSQREAAHALGVNSSSISKCCGGHQKHAGGFEWQNVFNTEPAWITGEVWKAAHYPGIDGAVSSWMVSNQGRIQTHTGRITRGSVNEAGYVSVHYAVKAKRFLVHRLVAASFLGQPSSAKLHVNHLDGIRANNHVHNLEYATPAENVQHALSRRAGRKIDRPNQKARVCS